MLTALTSGFILGGSLIIAIGAQNAFILRQGLLRQHVFILCLICAMSDALLIMLGVFGVGALIEQSKTLIFFITLAGVLFLLTYAAFAFQRAWQPNQMEAASEKVGSLKLAIATCLAFTFLNPHVYLDTVVLVGSFSLQYQGIARVGFAIGAALASFVWFYSLGYGARVLEPLFKNPKAWQVLDFIIGLIMLALGLSLAFHLKGLWAAL